MIALITENSNSVPLLEGLCSSNPFKFDFSVFEFLPESNRRACFDGLEGRRHLEGAENQKRATEGAGAADVGSS